MKKVIIFLLVIFLLPLVIAQVNVGVVDGYIFNTEGEVVFEADVIAIVTQCSVQCTQPEPPKKSELDGYYVINNLPLPKDEFLTVFAEKDTPLGLEFGFKVGQSNDKQVARSVNVTICLPPPPPIITAEPNTHDTSVVLEWTSFADLKPFNYPTHDEILFDNILEPNDNGPGAKTLSKLGLTFSPHSWQVRTCNPFCCSVFVTDSFNVGNVAPSTPILTDQLDIAPGPITLIWESGIDDDGDETFDEFEFIVFGDPSDPININPATSPISLDATSISFFTWRVRTCEVASEFLCSPWAEDGFVACGIQSPQCTPTTSSISFPSGSGGISTALLQSLAIITPLSIEEKNELPIKISYASGIKNRNIIFKIESPDFTFNDYLIADLEEHKAKFEMLGVPKEETTKGVYDLTLDVFINNQKTFSEDFSVTVRSPLRIRITNLLNDKDFPFILFSAILIIILGTVYFFMRNKKLIDYLKKRNRKKQIKKN